MRVDGVDAKSPYAAPPSSMKRDSVIPEISIFYVTVPG